MSGAATPLRALSLANRRPGYYCVLIARQHVREPHELSAPERAAFFEEMVRAGAALERVFGAVKA
jgi:diadenosine tetraphosphate (Ap4A) HIT family hydrolase